MFASTATLAASRAGETLVNEGAVPSTTTVSAAELAEVFPLTSV
jgi:hypothetical protein